MVQNVHRTGPPALRARDLAGDGRPQRRVVGSGHPRLELLRVSTSLERFRGGAGANLETVPAGHVDSLALSIHCCAASVRSARSVVRFSAQPWGHQRPSPRHRGPSGRQGVPNMALFRLGQAHRCWKKLKPVGMWRSQNPPRWVPLAATSPVPRGSHRRSCATVGSAPAARVVADVRGRRARQSTPPSRDNTRAASARSLPRSVCRAHARSDPVGANARRWCFDRAVKIRIWSDVVCPRCYIRQNQPGWAALAH